MRENEQLLLLIKSKGHCPFSSGCDVTCHCCIADTFCKPETDLNVIETRYKYAISLGLQRKIIPEYYMSGIFEELL